MLANALGTAHEAWAVRLRTKDLCDIGEVLLEVRTFVSVQRLVRGRREGCASVLTPTQSYLEFCASVWDGIRSWLLAAA